MIRTKGIVVRDMDYGDTSKILTIYTEEIGRISVMANGARNPKYKLMANTQLFSLNDYHLKRGKNFYFIQEADLLNSYYGLREDIYRLAYGSYILELIYKSIPMEEKNIRVFHMLNKALSLLEKMDKGFLRFIVAYELKYISFIGYRPYLDGCVLCSSEEFQRMKFSIRESGIICENCFSRDGQAIYIDSEIYKAMVYLLHSPLDQLDQLDIEDDILYRVHSILVNYILKSIDRVEFTSLRLLESLI